MSDAVATPTTAGRGALVNTVQAALGIPIDDDAAAFIPNARKARDASNAVVDALIRSNYLDAAYAKPVAPQQETIAVN